MVKHPSHKKTLILVVLGLLPALASWILYKQRTPTVIVAVIDTGVDVKNPEIETHLALNFQEKPNNGVDDDENGLIDDFTGWNVLDDSADVSDPEGSGTRISQEILQRDPNASILPIKVGQNPESVTPETLVSAIEYAKKRHAKLIHLSFSLPRGSEELKKMVESLDEENRFLVMAETNPQKDRFPQAYGKGFTSVASATLSGEISAWLKTFGDDFIELGPEAFKQREGSQ